MSEENRRQTAKELLIQPGSTSTSTWYKPPDFPAMSFVFVFVFVFVFELGDQLHFGLRPFSTVGFVPKMKMYLQKQLFKFPPNPHFGGRPFSTVGFVPKSD